MSNRRLLSRLYDISTISSVLKEKDDATPLLMFAVEADKLWKSDCNYLWLAISYLFYKAFPDEIGVHIDNICTGIQWRIKGEGGPLLTRCNLKQVKILHENALFLHKIFHNFFLGGALPSPHTLYPTLRLPYSKFLDPLLLVLRNLTYSTDLR